MSVDDLPTGGYGLRWGHRRTYNNQLMLGQQPISEDYGNGYNWMLEHAAYLVDLAGDESEIQVVITPRKSYWFKLVGSNYIGAYGALQSFYHDKADGTFRFVETSGVVWTFSDFDQHAVPAGMLLSITVRGQQTAIWVIWRWPCTSCRVALATGPTSRPTFTAIISARRGAGLHTA